MKTKHKITLGFAAEIVFFVSVGGFIANGKYLQALFCLIFAMITAGFVGKEIEKDVLERYKKGELKWDLYKKKKKKMLTRGLNIL